MVHFPEYVFVQEEDGLKIYPDALFAWLQTDREEEDEDVVLSFQETVELLRELEQEPENHRSAHYAQLLLSRVGWLGFLAAVYADTHCGKTAL